MTTTVLTMLLLGQAAAGVPASPQLSAQQRFDAATKASLAGKCADAIRMFDELAETPAAKKSPLVAATIALRKGVCLMRVGRGEEGASLLSAALPRLENAGDAYRDDVRTALLTLGQHAMLGLDYSTAIDRVGAALDKSRGDERIAPLMLLARFKMFDGGPQPIAHADEAIALIEANPAFTKKEFAAGQTLRARVLMNQGRNQEAYAALKASLSALGGLTQSVTLNDIATRSDLAIAALLNNDKEAARRYLAYTGAGRVAKSPFRTATYMSPPTCGGASGLRPEDFAVVEFSLGDDGAAVGVAPIYSTGNREIALEFARAVSAWSWKAEDVKALPPFFRHLIRVELRCSAAEDGPSVVAPLTTEAAKWFGQPEESLYGKSVPSDKSDAAAVKTALVSARAAGDKRVVAGLLARLGGNRLLPETERAAYLDEAMAIATSQGAPVAVWTWLKINRASGAVAQSLFDARRQEGGLRNLLADPRIESDALSAATIRLLVATPSYRRVEPALAETLLQAVISDQRLPEKHPLKVAAQLQLANILARRNDMAGAQALFAQTGLTEEQCALVGVKPALRSSGVDSSDYPTAALMMGFEGWVRTAFDISADGRTARQRVIAAYPPFVFNDAATGMTRDFRYQASYRPEGGVACSANSQSINFQIPR